MAMREHKKNKLFRGIINTITIFIQNTAITLIKNTQ